MSSTSDPASGGDAPDSAAHAPLAGVRVLELARVLAGPWAGQIFADLGADVIKVERPGGGDETRAWGPPFVTDDAGQNLSASYFHACNRGKRSMGIDLATTGGQALVRRLAAGADVVIENYKVGTLARYGLDYAALRALNPALVYCSITGFGQDGPYARRPGYDVVAQGISGSMSITGDTAGPPQKSGLATADLFTGTYAAVGMLAALHRARATGKGAHLDLALLDTQIAVLGIQGLSWMLSDNVPVRHGNAHASLVPYRDYPCRDGEVIVAVGNDQQFGRLCQVIDLPGLEADPRFATNATRLANRGVLDALVAERTAGWAIADLCAALERADVPAGPINTVDQAFADPQVIHRGIRVECDAEGTKLPSVASPFVYDGVRSVAATGAPRIGEHPLEWR